MTIKDQLLALCVVVVWGVNFVVMKIGLHDMPPFLLAGLRFLLVALPAILLVPRPALPLRWLAAYGMTISFGQFAFLFSAIKMGMPVGMASLVIQSQAFFTLMLGARWLGERLQWNQWLGILVAALGMVVLAESNMANASLPGMTLTTLLLTLAAAASWACGNICNKQIMRHHPVNAMSLVVWSALIPVGPFLLCSWLFEGRDTIVSSLTSIRLPTVLALMYLSFISTLIGYAIWGNLLARYETWRVAPLSLLVPVVGILSAASLLGENLSTGQLLGALLVMLGLLVNVFGARLWPLRPARQP
ncbi:EamA family transporter [Dickeya solani]|uniref:EamA family transporter n=2 Tax=Dickeya solani TaxID=1089444 RepID=A0AAP7E948_9GAMM|nr:EamA family transporter [Dickeya solani]ANE75332.1 acetylserine transporter [Dickeya solani IPO 2222]AUC42732.1 Permease of the drug/metabolite transporter (DMT) superfamily [Dickeya solani RNS 08.23.3.1.A]AUH09254.1 O-acetylserine/cysteine exporter [Dickeya solani D s0432-1]AUH13227.1 O-acetylserine/cysteine exporter [Dickeya solani]AYQ49878.1 putative amino-acid metabolite efflux pump [Dickeya solani]